MSRSEVVELLSQLISIPSINPPGNEHTIVPYLTNYLQALGADVQIQVVLPNRPNIIANFNWGIGPRLMFNTHMDVHNPEGQNWNYEPFKPQMLNDRLYGRGSADAKGGLAAMLSATRKLVDNPTGLQGSLIFTIVMGEESGGLGTAHLVSNECEADGAIVGEPTELRIMAANKGTFIRKITFKGKAAHSGQAHLGRNAIEPAIKLLTEVFKANEILKEKPHPLVGVPSLIPTIINGGTAQNTIPGSCQVVIDRRLVPGENHQQAREQLDDIIATAGVASEILEIEEVVKTDPCETDINSTIVSCARQVLADYGETSDITGFPAGCDMSKLVLRAGIPTIILGPGSLAQAHGSDEYVDILQLNKASFIYENVARNFLRGDRRQ